jgi:hypothetical protein
MRSGKISVAFRIAKDDRCGNRLRPRPTATLTRSVSEVFDHYLADASG